MYFNKDVLNINSYEWRILFFAICRFSFVNSHFRNPAKNSRTQYFFLPPHLFSVWWSANPKNVFQRCCYIQFSWYSLLTYSQHICSYNRTCSLSHQLHSPAICFLCITSVFSWEVRWWMDRVVFQAFLAEYTGTLRHDLLCTWKGSKVLTISKLTLFAS